MNGGGGFSVRIRKSVVDRRGGGGNRRKKTAEQCGTPGEREVVVGKSWEKSRRRVKRAAKK